MAFEDKFSLKKIGTGHQYSPGSFASYRRKGLAGVLREAKTSGYISAKNLSTQDLKAFQRIIGDELHNLPSGTEALPRYARLKIMEQAESLRRKGTISAADKEDLKKIVDKLAEKKTHNTTGTNKERATKFTTRQGSPWQSAKKPEKVALSPEQEKRMKAYIKMDISDELAAEERGESTMNHRAGSTLARYEEQERQAKPRAHATFNDNHPHNSLGLDEDKKDDVQKDPSGKPRVDLSESHRLLDLDIG